MTALFCDSAAHYAAADGIQKWLAHNCTMQANQGRRTGQAALGLNNNQSVQTKYFASHATMIVGCAVRTSGTNMWVPIRVIDSGTTQVEVRMLSNTFQIYNGAGTLLGSGGSYVVGNWYYIELKVTVNNTTGSAVLRVNGATVINLTSVDTQQSANASANGFIAAGSVNVTVQHYLTDLYICNGAGTRNNDFLGDSRVEYLAPSGAGFNTGLTSSGGAANYLNVDEMAPNGDTDYNTSGVVGTKDTYALNNLPSGAGSVKFIQTVVYARKDDAGSRTFEPVIRSGAVDYNRTAQVLGDSYTYFTEIEETDPATALDWTVAGVDAVELGVRVAT